MRKWMLAVAAVCVAFTAQSQTETKSFGAGDVAGHYRFASGQIMTLERFDDNVTVSGRGQSQNVLTKKPDGSFAYPSSGAHLTFDADAQGVVKALHYHFDGQDYAATRIDDAAFKLDSEAWDLKIKNQISAPECAAAVKRLVDEVRAGEPDYSKLAPIPARAVRSQLSFVQPRFQSAGATKEVKFKSVDSTGNEIFDVTFENGTVTTWRVLCFDDGHLGAVAFRT